MPRNHVFLFAVLFILPLGCKNLEVRDRWFDSDRVSKVPSEILPIWSETVLHQPGKPGIRGFGGRVYFYENGKPDPVMVDGQLAIYAFDGSPTSPEVAVPLRKFVFTPDQLTGHHSKSSLGNSYSVWIPWDKVGGESRTLSLVARFDGRAGGTAMSKPSTMLLPGASPETVPVPNHEHTVQLASHDELAPQSELFLKDAEREPNAKLESASIDLPPSFQRRLMANVSTSQEAMPSTDRIASSRDSTESAWQPLSPRERAADNVSKQLQATIAQEKSPPTAGVGPDSQLGARLSPQRFPARRTPRARPGPAVLRRQPHPGGWPAGLPATPRSGSNWQSTTDSQARVSTRSETERQPSRF